MEWASLRPYRTCGQYLRPAHAFKALFAALRHFAERNATDSAAIHELPDQRAQEHQNTRDRNCLPTSPHRPCILRDAKRTLVRCVVRNMDGTCVVIPPMGQQTRYRGRRALAVENRHLRVTVLVEGGHIAEIYDKAAGVNPLWTPPWQTIDPSAYGPPNAALYGEGADG